MEMATVTPKPSKMAHLAFQASLAKSYQRRLCSWRVVGGISRR